MVSKKLTFAYTLSTILLLAAGVITLVLSLLWRSSDPLRNLILTSSNLTSGIVLGVMYLATVIVAVAAIIQPVHVTLGLQILNWTLVADSIATIVIGSIIWFFTLKERNNYFNIYAKQSQASIQSIQDSLQCCGYFNATDILIQQGFCQSLTNATQLCVGPITNKADFTLNNVFSTIYGWMAIIIALFLVSMCIIKKRDEQERFRRIDEKRGGRGFV